MSTATTPLSFLKPLTRLSSSSSSSSSSVLLLREKRFSMSSYPNHSFNSETQTPISIKKTSSPTKHVCKAAAIAAEYKFPDPIPEFADAETEKFREHLRNKLSKKDVYGDSLDEVVNACTEIFSKFLHTEYGGPGTLLVVPFIDMADILKERGLPGASQAARIAVKWAQNHVDKDWNEWTGEDSN